eukprot:2598098-Amphidinium_carterae.1
MKDGMEIAVFHHLLRSKVPGTDASRAWFILCSFLRGGSGSPKTRAKAGLLMRHQQPMLVEGVRFLGRPQPTLSKVVVSDLQAHGIRGLSARESYILCAAGRAENVSAGDAAAGAPNHPQVPKLSRLVLIGPPQQQMSPSS